MRRTPHLSPILAMPTGQPLWAAPRISLGTNIGLSRPPAPYAEPMGQVIEFPRRRGITAPTLHAVAPPSSSRSASRERADLKPPATSDSPRPTPARPDRPGPRQMLWREAIGHQFRTERTRREQILAEVAAAAGVSTQYLSEVERGLKEPSSEIIGAIASALGLTLGDLTERISRSLRGPEHPAPEHAEPGTGASPSPDPHPNRASHPPPGTKFDAVDLRYTEHSRELHADPPAPATPNSPQTPPNSSQPVLRAG